MAASAGNKGLLSGLTCLITGASRGIGAAIALAFAKENAGLILAARTKEALEGVAAKCKQYNAEFVKIETADLSTAAGAQNLAERVKQTTDGYGVDVLVNNAGVRSIGNAVEGDFDEWATCLNVNVLAPMILTNLFSAKMIERQSGVIINIGSIAAVEGMTKGGVYSTSKFGIRGWSLHTQRILKPHKIKVMIINPGFVHTDMISWAALDKNTIIQPEDIAEAALLPFRTSAACCPEELVVRISGVPSQ